MPASTNEIARVQEFLNELTELSRRTGIVVSGCGGHDSPSLLINEELPQPWDREGWYVLDYKPDVDDGYSRRFADVRWRPSADNEAYGRDVRRGLEDASSLLPVAGPTAKG